jgi:rhamnulokinase
MSTLSAAAVDLGASGGRVMTATVGDGVLDLREVHRFPNRPVTVGGTLHWDVLALYAGIVEGLAAARHTAAGVDSIGIDSWAIDYGVLDGSGVLLGNPVHYRDRRTDGVMTSVVERIGAARMYEITGLQQLPFNTIYQLVAAKGSTELAHASSLLLIPDLFGYWLTGQRVTELTNASTTQLLDVSTRTWSPQLLAAIGLDASVWPPLTEPAAVVGTLLPEVAEATGLAPDTPVVTVASHDTASAVIGVPAESPNFAYISCGTWSLVGLELDSPVLTEESRVANFTNEAGIDSTVRYLRNVMGLWLLQESLRTWAGAGLPADLEQLLAQAAAVPAFTNVIDPDHPTLLPPGDMPSRVAGLCIDSGQAPPRSPAETVRCILDSLALAYRRAISAASELSGRDVDVVHVVGGGARNSLLCQLTADACGLPVLAGPVEASALGNALVQGRAAGVIPPDLPAMRALLVQTQSIRRFNPTGSQSVWDAAQRRVGT